MFASIQHCCYIQFVYCQTSTRQLSRNTGKINENTQEGVIHIRCNPRSSHSIISPQSDLRKLNRVRQHDPVYIRALSMITLLCVPAQHMSLDVAMPPVAHCPIITLTSSHETPLMFDVRCMVCYIIVPQTYVALLAFDWELLLMVL